MNAAFLIATLLSAEEPATLAEALPPVVEIDAGATEVTATVDAPAEEVVAAPSAEELEYWPGEGTRRVRFGLGTSAHVGALDTIGGIGMVIQSEFTFFISVRVLTHHEWRVGIALAAGWPDSLAGETKVSFRYHFTPQFSVGAGVLTYWGFWSLRGGAEIPFSYRFGSTRRHEVNVTLRGTAGVFNRSTYVWYDFARQRFAYAGDISVGYSAIF